MSDAMSGRLATSRALHDRVRRCIGAFTSGARMPEPFDALASAIAQFQAEHVPGYARLCKARGLVPAALRIAADAPAVPTDAFKLAPVFAFDPSDAENTFRTSGTTIGGRGEHRMRDTRTYDAAAIAFGRVMLASSLAPCATAFVLGPSPDEAPDSSLMHMCALFARALVSPAAVDPFFVRAGRLETERLAARIAAAKSRGPIVILATSFALVHLLDVAGGDAERRFSLPLGSRVMQTGGFKGRSREVPAPLLRRDVARLFDVSERAVVNEYGMTELSTQFWEATLCDPSAPHGVFFEPPWARVVAVDPETLAPVADGQIGIARIEDLANVDSAFAVLASDRVRRVRGGFELLGRTPGATPRGCSIAMDEILSAGAPA